MQHDEVIWQVIRHKHCSYMAKINSGIFCRNPYNVTGICNRSSCPLANSRYATIRDHDASHKMTQMRIRMRKLALKTREKIMTTPRKEKKREARREEKAEKAAVLEKSIEKELLERLKGGIYDDIYNYPFDKYKKILEGEEAESEEEVGEEPEIEYVEGYDELEEEDDIEDFGGFAMKGSHKSEDNVAADADDDNRGEDDSVEHKRVRRGSSSAREKLEKDSSSTKGKKRARVLVEVEHEDAAVKRKATL